VWRLWFRLISVDFGRRELVKGREAGIIYLDQELTDGKSTVLLNLMSTVTSFDSIFVSRLYSEFA
jgi:hypothetical protein